VLLAVVTLVAAGQILFKLASEPTALNRGYPFVALTLIIVPLAGRIDRRRRIGLGGLGFFRLGGGALGDGPVAQFNAFIADVRVVVIGDNQVLHLSRWFGIERTTQRLGGRPVNGASEPVQDLAPSIDAIGRASAAGCGGPLQGSAPPRGSISTTPRRPPAERSS
jgi:hypothetical protein